ncbi:hypothetical protein H5410_018539 [Solanum commersonii]|uniref:Uncharacterized protein n=1 Tax=Solanum commersonii TaxID=4109 RepID=A0A9J6A340_SOLCO|nr:hypothetical protein H5410_018539 [Solanum commersonii]
MEQLAHLLQNHLQVVAGRPICLQIQVVRKHEHYHLTYLMYTALDLLDVLQQLGGYLNCCRKMTRIKIEKRDVAKLRPFPPKQEENSHSYEKRSTTLLDHMVHFH